MITSNPPLNPRLVSVCKKKRKSSHEKIRRQRWSGEDVGEGGRKEDRSKKRRKE